MQKILSKRERIILYTVLGLIGLSIVFNFLIEPLFKKAELLNRQTDIVRTKLKKYMWLLSQKDNIQDKYKKFASRLNLPSERKDTSVTTLSVLENLAKEAEIHIVDIRPQTTSNLDLYKETVVDLRTEGTMEGYISFLYNIENSLSLLRIKKFQLNAKPKSSLLEGIFSISQLSLTE